MNWSQEAWNKALPAYEKILTLPFITELMDGSLDKEKFDFYIQQDSLYLSGFGKALAGIGAKLDNLEHSQAFLSFARDTMAVEHELHASYVGTLHPGIKPSPSCLLYVSFLLRQLHDAPVEVAAAAVLPCFWVYKEVGEYILRHQTKENNQYQAWIDTYGGEEFAEAVNRAIAICDELAARVTPAVRQTMTEVYVLATRMEWMFWESASRLEEWPV